MAWIGRLVERYRRWEARTVDRTASWSRPRRWLIFVLLPCALLCGGGITVGAPLMWIIGPTIAASRGAASPAAAVDTYLMALSYDNDAGLLPVLDDDQGDALLAQWKAYRAQMHRGDSAPSRLDVRIRPTRPTGKGHAIVEVELYPVWWDKNGGAISYQGTAQVWTFHTREDNGWQIEAVTPYPRCGGYVAAAACD